MVRIIQSDFHLVRFSTAVLAEIANRLGKNIEIVVMDSVGRAAALASGAVDAVFWTRTNDLSNQLFYPSAFLREIRLDPRLYILPDVFPIGGIIRKMQTRGSEEIRNLICPYFSSLLSGACCLINLLLALFLLVLDLCRQFRRVFHD